MIPNLKGLFTRIAVAACGVVITALVMIPVPKAWSSADPYRDVGLALIRQLVTIFPPVEGYVVSLSSGEIYVDLTAKDVMKPGMELLIYREGEDIVHPLTGDVLGKYEEKLGYMVLRAVHDDYSVGTQIEGGSDVMSGDKVRISSRPLRTLLFFAGESPAVQTGRLAQGLSEAAEESRRFRLRDEPAWLPLLGELDLTVEGLLGDAAAHRRLGKRAKADLLLVANPPRGEDNSILFDVRSLKTGRSIAQIRQPWVEVTTELAGHTPPAGFPRNLFGRNEQEAAERNEYRKKELSMVALSILAGHFRGEGALDILVTDGRRLALYSWEGGGLLWKWEEDGAEGRHVIGLESGDLNGDKKPEVIVTTLKRGRLKTRVISWEEGQWAKLGEVEGLFLRVLQDPHGETVVFGQRRGVNTVFSGKVREFAWEGGGFTPLEDRVLPQGVDIFGLGLADLDGDGEAEILSLNRKGELRIVGREGETIFQTSENYGGYPPRLKKEDLFGMRLADEGVDAEFSDGGGGSGESVEDDVNKAFQGRILTVEHDRGSVTFVVPHNFSGPGAVLPNLRRFDKGVVVLLGWRDGGIVETRRSSKQEGYIADIALGDVNGDGRDDILMAVNRPSGVLLRQRGALVIWDAWRPGEEPESGR